MQDMNQPGQATPAQGQESPGVPIPVPDSGGARGFGGTPDPKPPTDETGAELPTKQEQMDYDLIVVRAQKMIFGDGKDNILKMLGTSQTPAEGLGKVAAMIIGSLTKSAKQSGRDLSPDAALSAGSEVVQDLSDLAKANGVYQYKDDQEEVSQLQDAMLYGVKAYGDGMVANGDITPEMQQVAKKQVQEGLAQEQSGNPGGGMQPVAQGVQAAMQPQGMVAGAMNRGTA